MKIDLREEMESSNSLPTSILLGRIPPPLSLGSIPPHPDQLHHFTQSTPLPQHLQRALSSQGIKVRNSSNLIYNETVPASLNSEISPELTTTQLQTISLEVPSDINFTTFKSHKPGKKRWKPTHEQKLVLEEVWKQEAYPNAALREQLEKKLGTVTAKQISGWFKHKREVRKKKFLTNF